MSTISKQVIRFRLAFKEGFGLLRMNNALVLSYLLNYFSMADWRRKLRFVLSLRIKNLITPMSAYNIQWRATHQDLLQNEKYAQFFALVQNGKLIYIGLAFRQNISQTIPAFILRNNLDPANLKVYLGRIKEYTVKALDVQHLRAVHDLLVFARKPILNLTGRFDYQSQGDLRVINSGFELLPLRLREENKNVFVSAQSC